MSSKEPSVIRMFFQKSNKFGRIFQSDKKDTSVSFGVGGIISSIFTVAFAFLFAVGIASITSVNGTSGKTLGFFVSNMFFGLLALIIGGASTVLLIINSLMDVVYQFKMNKKAIRYVTLVLFLASFIGAAVLVITSII